MKRKNLRIGISISLLLFFCTSLFVGAMDLTLAGLLNGDASMIHTFLYSRFPRSISVIIASMSLALSGLIMQKISANKFVSPQTAITGDAIKFGVLLSLIFGLNKDVRFILSIVIAFVTSILFFKIVNSFRRYDPITIPIFGIVCGGILSACTNLIALRFDFSQTLNSIFNQGFTSIFKGEYEILFLNLVLILIASIYFKQFMILGTGVDFATNLGISIKTISNLGLLIVSILSANVSLTVGSIPFVGLLIPNLVTVVFDDSSQGVVIDTLLLSSLYMLVCDVLARVIIYPYEVPIVLVSGILGSLLFIKILLGGPHER